MFSGSGVRIIGKDIIDAKLLAAAPRILANNRSLVMSMLEFIKAEVQPQMPQGPGHFGYHARDKYRIDVSSAAVKTTGKLWGAVEAYWREYGTLGRFKKGSYAKATASNARAALYAATRGTGGESPRPITHQALLAARRFINFYYNGTFWKGL
jgi:hypothetical protein